MEFRMFLRSGRESLSLLGVQKMFHAQREEKRVEICKNTRPVLIRGRKQDIILNGVGTFLFRNGGLAFGPLQLFYLLRELASGHVSIALGDPFPYFLNISEEDWEVRIECEELVLAGWQWITLPVTLRLNGRNDVLPHIVDCLSNPPEKETKPNLPSAGAWVLD